MMILSVNAEAILRGDSNWGWKMDGQCLTI